MSIFYGFSTSLFGLRYAGYPFSEIITILYIIYAFLERKKIGGIHPILLIAILFISYSFVTARSRGYFLQSSFINNFVRFSFYAFGTMVIPYYLIKKQQLHKLFIGLGWAIQLCCFLALIEFFAKNVLDVWVDWQIPGISMGYGSISSGNRARSIFSEPAHFGIFTGVSTILYIRYYVDKIKPKRYYQVIVAAVMSILVTLSLGSYTFLAIIIYLVYNDLNNSRLISPTVKRYIYLSLFVVGSSIITYFIASGLLQKLIIDRIVDVMAGQDGSAQHRLLGQFELVRTGLMLYPINGIGLGQSLAFLENGDFAFENLFFMKGFSTQSGVNNIFVYILLQTGYVGFSIFIAYFISSFRFDRYILLTFILMCFAWGYFNSPFFWFFIYMVAALKLDKSYQQKIRKINPRPQTINP